MVVMKKKQLKMFKESTKGTSKNPTLVLVTWKIWHKLPEKVQQSKLRTIVVISNEDDWSEDVWVHGTIDEALRFHQGKLVIVGNTKHVNMVIDSLPSRASATIMDTTLRAEPYEYIV